MAGSRTKTELQKVYPLGMFKIRYNHLHKPIEKKDKKPLTKHKDSRSLKQCIFFGKYFMVQKNKSEKQKSNIFMQN